MTNLSEKLKSIKPADMKYAEIYPAAVQLREIAIKLAEAIEDNKSASELGFQVYPLEKTILKALADCAKMLEEGK